MNRKGLCGSRVGSNLDMWSMFEPEAASASVKRPPSRKDLMLLIRRSDEADGDNRMIGSMRRPVLGRLEFRAGFCGIDDGGAPGRPVTGCGRLFRKNVSACLRICEKSWPSRSATARTKNWSWSSYSRLYTMKNTVSVPHSSF